MLNIEHRMLNIKHRNFRRIDYYCYLSYKYFKIIQDK